MTNVAEGWTACAEAKVRETHKRIAEGGLYRGTEGGCRPRARERKGFLQRLNWGANGNGRVDVLGLISGSGGSIKVARDSFGKSSGSRSVSVAGGGVVRDGRSGGELDHIRRLCLLSETTAANEEGDNENNNT